MSAAHLASANEPVSRSRALIVCQGEMAGGERGSCPWKGPPFHLCKGSNSPLLQLSFPPLPVSLGHVEPSLQVYGCREEGQAPTLCLWELSRGGDGAWVVHLHSQSLLCPGALLGGALDWGDPDLAEVAAPGSRLWPLVPPGAGVSWTWTTGWRWHLLRGGQVRQGGSVSPSLQARWQQERAGLLWTPPRAGLRNRTVAS